MPEGGLPTPLAMNGNGVRAFVNIAASVDFQVFRTAIEGFDRLLKDVLQDWPSEAQSEMSCS